MTSPAQSRGARKGIRDAVQAVLAVVAAGGATAAIDLVVDHVEPAYGVLMAFVFKIVIAYAQNYLETAGKIPVFLPTPGLVSAVLDPVEGAVTDSTPLVAPAAAATVDAVADAAGKVTGDVVDTAGGVVGAVTGQLLDDDERGGAGMIALLVIGFCILIIVGFFSVCDLAFNDEDEPGDNHLLGRIELISHDDDGGCWDGECYDDGNGGGRQDYDQWNNQDRNRNRNRNRGAFSPGPFDDSPVDAFNGNTICLPGSTCYADDRQRDEQPPDEREMP